MVDKIYIMKNEILEQAKKELEERGPERMDVDRLGTMVDMVHHLAEAESACWQAEYYRTVTEAMKDEPHQVRYASTSGRSGYPGHSNNVPMEHDGNGSNDNGSGGNLLSNLETMFRNMPPDERARTKSQVITMLGSM